MNSQAPSAGLMLAVLALCAHAETPIRSTATRLGVDQVLISWDTVPAKVYQFKTTTDLSLPWQVLPTTPILLTASSNNLSYTVPIESGKRFFRVMKADTEPPRVMRLNPLDGAIAVLRDQPLQATLQDESGIAPGSISLAIGTNPPVTLADPRLTFTNNVLTYTPTNGQTLGNYADQVADTITVADTLGNTLTNYPWTFSLELQTVLSDKIIFLSHSAAFRPQSVSGTGLTLISTNGDLFTYSFTGTNCGLTNGLYLVDPDLYHGYTRTVVSFVEDPTNRTVAVTTKPTALAKLLETGSFSSAAVLTNLAPRPLHADWSAGAGIQLQKTIDLSHKLYDQNNILLELTKDSKLDLDLRADISADFSAFRLSDIQVTLSGSANFKAVFHALADYAKHWEGEVPLLEPIHQFYGGFVGPIPVWVEAVWEFNAGYEADLEAKAELTVGCQAHKDVLIGRRWDGEWRDSSQHPPASFEVIGPTWQIEGSASVRGYVQPKLTLYVESLAGLSADLEPYVELAGSAQLNPPACEWGVYAGISGELALDLRGWDDDWGALPSWPFDLIPRTTIYHRDCGTEKPTVIHSPSDTTVSPGGTAFFTVDAQGAEPLSYQWQHNSVNLADGPHISGVQSASLYILGATAADAGEYRVRVSNAAGSALSGAATLTVQGGAGTAPTGMALIPAGSFTMGDAIGDGYGEERPVHTAYVSAFYMDKYLVTKALWDEVYAWAVTHGYSLEFAGSGKAANHPVQTIDWYDAVKWCNARSQREGRTPAYYTDVALSVVYKTGPVAPYVRWNTGYRLPTEAEWEKAARGGLSGRRFPWGDTISWSQANYYAYPLSAGGYAYDVNPTSDFHPTFAVGGYSPYTNPVDYFVPNGYGLYDMAGNVWEWCWDWYGGYSSGSQSDPRGPALGSYRLIRGGCWDYFAFYCRAARRYSYWPDNWNRLLGFRSVLPPGQP